MVSNNTKKYFNDLQKLSLQKGQTWHKMYKNGFSDSEIMFLEHKRTKFFFQKDYTKGLKNKKWKNRN